ncbi:oxidoreductase [Thalassobaculum sp.]|uniref:oxidoreductase n=1 Tax=Thalassobaculum sp. TaxID=2022740 RepID=UPI0032ECD0D3
MVDGDAWLADPLRLPCGAVLRSRIAKPAMSDSLADGTGDATGEQAALYRRWAEGGIALSIVGEVQGDPTALENPGNLVLHAGSDVRALEKMTAAATAGGAHLWAQLGHAGALAHSGVGRRVGPSALSLDGLQCSAMTVDEIEALSARYAETARIAISVGFTGVQVHAAHGFLLSQFLSPLFNRRDDAWGGSLENRLRLPRAVLHAVREAVGPDFPVGFKINAADGLEGGLSVEDSLAAIRSIDADGIDLLEISEGTYFPGAPSSSDGDGGGVHAFCRDVRRTISTPVMAAGGFKTRTQALNALEQGAVDVIGVARAAVLDPELGRNWLRGTGPDLAFPRFPRPVPAGGITAWYTLRIAAIAEGRDAAFDATPAEALALMRDRDAERAPRWRARFALPEPAA